LYQRRAKKHPETAQLSENDTQKHQKSKKKTPKMPYFSRMSVTFLKMASNGLDICILKDLGLNWRVTKILSQIWFRGSVMPSLKTLGELSDICIYIDLLDCFFVGKVEK